MDEHNVFSVLIIASLIFADYCLGKWLKMLGEQVDRNERLLISLSNRVLNDADEV